MVLNLPSQVEFFEMRFEGVDYYVIERESLQRVLDSVRGVAKPAVVTQEAPAPEPPAPEIPAEMPAEVIRTQSQQAEAIESPVPGKRAQPSPIAAQILTQLPGTVAEVAERLGWDRHRVQANLACMAKRGMVANIDGDWRAVDGEAALAAAQSAVSDRDLVRQCLREYGKPLEALDVRVWCKDRGRTLNADTILEQLASEGELRVTGTVRNRSYELAGDAPEKAPEPESAPEPVPVERVTNKELVRRAVIDGPKTALQVAQWVRAHGYAAMNESLAEVLLERLQDEKQVEEVNATTPGQDSIWQKVSGEKE